MSPRSFFDALEQEPLERVTNAIGMAFAAEAASVLPAFAHDDTISPAVLQAGVLKAHLLGGLAAISTVVLSHEDPAEDDVLLAGIGEFLRDGVAQMRGV